MSTVPLGEDTVLEALRNVKYPGFSRDIVSFGFVKDIADDPIDLAMVQAINAIGHVMGLKTIAEYVASEAILEKLREIGVDYGQGYHLGAPRPLAELGTVRLMPR